MKKGLSLFLSFVMIFMMMPMPVSAEVIPDMIPAEETGFFLLRIHNESSYAVGSIVQIDVLNDKSPKSTELSLPETIGARELDNFTVNSTTESIIHITVDGDNLGSSETISAFDPGQKKVIDIHIEDGMVSFSVSEWIEPESIEVYLEVDESSEFSLDGLVKIEIPSVKYSSTRNLSLFINDPIRVSSYSKPDLLIEATWDSNGNGMIDELDSQESFTNSLASYSGFAFINIVVDENKILFSDLSATSSFIDLNPNHDKRIYYYNHESPDRVLWERFITKPGTYDFYELIESADKITYLYYGNHIIEAGDFEELILTPVGTTTTYPIERTFNLDGFDLKYDNSVYRGFSIYSEESNPDVDFIETNITDLSRNLAYEGPGGHVMFELDNLNFDFSNFTARLTVDELQEEFTLKEHMEFVDAHGNVMRSQGMTTENSRMVISNSEGNQSLDWVDNMFVGHLNGTYSIEIQVPELGIDFSNTIYIHGTPPKYETYEVVVENMDGTPNISAIGFYDGSTFNKKIAAFIPEDSVNKIKIYGVNGTEKTKLEIVMEVDSSSVASYDPNTDIVTLAPVSSGDWNASFGTVDGEVRLDLRSYKGSIGVMDITTPDGAPFSGRVNMASMYNFTNHGGSGSFHDAYAFGGKLPFAIQTDFVGLEYAYYVVSPENNDKTAYANTPFIDLTEEISTPQPGVYYLGATQFQTPAYVGRVFRSDGTTPADNIFATAVGHYIGSDYDFETIDLYLASGKSGDHYNLFYAAPLGEGFTNNMDIRLVVHNSDFQTIDASINLLDGEGVFTEPTPQMEVTLYDDQGQLLPEGHGLDRSLQAIIMRGDSTPLHKELSTGYISNVKVGGFEPGDEVTMWLNLDLGDFDHLKLVNSNDIHFTYTNIPGSYEAVDEAGNKIPYIVDEAGTMHLDIHANKAQLFGFVKMGDDFVNSEMHVQLLDPVNRYPVAQTGVHTAGGYNGEEIMYGVISMGHHTQLTGQYILSIENPKDTIYYTGTEIKLTFPLEEDLIIQLPESRAYGKVQLTEEDEEAFANNFLRVFVNIFDETGRYIKNARVRNDGFFSAGELADGRYFSKVFVSPFSPLADKYASSRMNLFELNSTANQSEFIVPLIKTMGKGLVQAPDGTPAQEIWVNIMNAQGSIVESVKTNDQGQYPIPVLSDGKYTFKALGANGAFDSLGHPITIINGVLEGETTLNLTQAQVFGDIFNPSNVNEPGTVYIYDAMKKPVTSSYTDNGMFAVGGLTSGNYYVQVKPDNGIYDATEMIPFTYNGSSVSVQVTLLEAEYSGIVYTGMSIPAAEGWVHLYKDDAYVKSVSIGSDGSYAIGGIDETGAFTVMAESRGLWSKRLPIGENKVMDIQLESDQLVHGAIEVGGEVFSNGEFIIYDHAYNAIMSVRTNAFGDFSLSGLEPGEYKIVVILGDLYYVSDLTLTAENKNVGVISLVEGE